MKSITAIIKNPNRRGIKMKDSVAGQINPDSVITALLVYLSPEFPNAPDLIHETIYGLQQEGKYHLLLDGFEFIKYSRCHYSPLLGRILNRLQEARLLSSRNPDYAVYQVKPESKDAIESYYLNEGKALHDYRGQLKGIATQLRKELAHARK